MENKQDELIFRFTAWLKVVVKRAKIDFIRKLKHKPVEVSIEDETVLTKLIYEPNFVSNPSASFEFDDVLLSVAFDKLSPKRKEILILLFVHNLTPEEIAEEIECSVQHVYNQRSLALKELRMLLRKE